MENDMELNKQFSNNDLAARQRESLVHAPSELDLERERKRQKLFKILKSVLVYTFLGVVAIMSFLPFYWMIMSSFKTEPEYRQALTFTSIFLSLVLLFIVSM